MITESLFRTPLLGILDHRHPDPVLDAAKGVNKLGHQEHRGAGAGGNFVQSNERGAAHGFYDVVIDVCHKKPD
jgi:hypothetical protein